MEGTHDLSEVFRHMAKTTKLLGSAIYEIQEVWKGLDKLWQANYTLRSLPKGLKFLLSGTPIGVPEGYGTGGHTQPRHPSLLQWHDPLPLVWEGGQEWGDSHQPPLDGALQAWPGVQQMLHLPIKLIRHPPPPQLAEVSILRRGRPQWVSLVRVTASRRYAELISPNWESEQRIKGNSTSLGLPYWGHPCPLAQPWRITRWRRCHPPTCNVLSAVFPYVLTRWLPTTLESHKTSTRSVGLYKLKIES